MSGLDFVLSRVHWALGVICNSIAVSEEILGAPVAGGWALTVNEYSIKWPSVFSRYKLSQAANSGLAPGLRAVHPLVFPKATASFEGSRVWFGVVGFLADPRSGVQLARVPS